MQNPRVLAARKLRRRAQRDSARAYLIEGTVPVREALAARAAVREVFLAEGHPDGDAIESEAAGSDAAVVRVTSSVLDALADTATPQGVVAVAEMADVADVPEGTDLALVLDQIRDPGNAGTLLRCAAAAGTGAAVFSSGSVDPYSPKTVRAAAGALFRVPLVRDAPLEEIASTMRARGLRLVGADARAPDAYDSLDYTGPIAFVVGNEAWGIAPQHRDLLDAVVGIPMPGDAESLNAAIAGAILLFEAVRQRRISSTPA